MDKQKEALFHDGTRQFCRFDEDLKQFIEQKIAQRLQAKKDKNYALADQIRNELTEKGIVLKDTPNGTEWSI